MILDHKTLEMVVELVAEKKGADVLVLNLSGLSMITDYCLIVTGNTSVQVKAIAEYLYENLPEIGIPVLRMEGVSAAKWVLLDCSGDLVIHVMTPGEREFYQLERLWKDAEVLTFEANKLA